MRISMLCSGNIVHAAPFYELRTRKNAETLVVEKRLVDNFNFDVFSGAIVELEKNFYNETSFFNFFSLLALSHQRGQKAGIVWTLKALFLGKL